MTIPLGLDIGIGGQMSPEQRDAAIKGVAQRLLVKAKRGDRMDTHVIMRLGGVTPLGVVRTYLYRIFAGTKMTGTGAGWGPADRARLLELVTAGWQGK